MCLSKKGCFSTVSTLAKRRCLISADDAWTSQLSIFLTCLSLALMSSDFYTAPTHCVLWTLKTLAWNTSLWGFFAGCRVGSVRRSLYIHLLSLLPWQAKEELCLQKLHCSHFPAFTSHGCHGDRPNEHDCTVRQTCRKGRRDVLFSPTMAFTLLCQRLSTSASLIRLPGLAAAHVGACANTQSHKVLPRREIPASGVCWISRVRC